jgi:predicted HAD superfamily Cof-like phosphohydrolase
MSVFEDQAKFMGACGQTVGKRNPEQFDLYLKLIREEATELFDAVATNNTEETFDALLDIIVVCIGAGISAGFPMNEGWKEVIRSNMDKVDPETGYVRRRSDGKILKPENWTPPMLAQLLKSDTL